MDEPSKPSPADVRPSPAQARVDERSRPPRAETDELARSIHNEQIKLRATGLNTIAVGFVVAGVITPLTLLGVGTGGTSTPGQALALLAIWLVGAFALHVGALLTLRSLRWVIQPP